jgi:hypothetical protein
MRSRHLTIGMPPAYHCLRPQSNRGTLPRSHSKSLSMIRNAAKGHIRSGKAHPPLFRKADMSCPINIQSCIKLSSGQVGHP